MHYRSLYKWPERHSDTINRDERPMGMRDQWHHFLQEVMRKTEECMFGAVGLDVACLGITPRLHSELQH